MRALPSLLRVRRSALLPAALMVLAVLSLVPAGASAKVLWLCKPGQRANPCEPSLATSLFTPSGKRLGVRHPRRPSRPRADCFYQAARYSQDCRVAPVYRQITVQGLGQPQTVTPAMRESAYGDVVQPWRTYLRRFNHGRGVVLISHSQGTFVLRRLIREEIDPRPAARRRLVSAVLLGGNVTVREGGDRGGDFKKLRACRRARQVGCIIAFSTFNAPVPQGSRFGRTTEPGREVLCTNPAALGGGSGRITPVYPTTPFAPSAIGSAVAFALQGLPRPSTLADGNVALGTLVDVVRRQIGAWTRR